MTQFVPKERKGSHKPLGLPRESSLLSGLYPCPYCFTNHRTVGWLCWHIKHGHTDKEIRDFSRTSRREAYPDKYINQTFANIVRR